MKYTDLHDLLEELVEEETYPITTSELADRHRQISGNYIAQLLEEAPEEEFESVDEISEWMNERDVTFGLK